MKGKFIVIEGLEGAGKSSAHQSVVRVLHETEEPVTDKAELLMLYAARIQLVENVIKPALMQGKWVVGDRHDMSSQAYQGGGRQLDPNFMLTLKETVLGNFEPDLTIYLDIDPIVGLARARGRGELDRIEQMDLDFFHRTRARYLELVKDNPKAVVINAEQTIELVQADIESAVKNWWKLRYYVAVAQSPKID